MVAFNAVKSGDRLFQVRRQKMGNTTMSCDAVFTVRILEVDAEGRRVFASWNGNAPRWEGRKFVEGLRRTEPKPKG